MPGEQLTCVIHLAYEKYKESSLQRSTIDKVFAAINTYKCLCFTKKEFNLEFTENVTFSKLKEFILSKRNNGTTKREIQDKIENACWNLCKDAYCKCPFRSSEVYKLWLIFNRVADEETYPPVITTSYSSWIIEKFISVAGLSMTKTSGNSDLTFQDFLRCLEDSFTAESIIPVTKEIHDWLVKEVIKAGWVYVRIKRRGNWSLWGQRWMNISPGKIYISKREHEHSANTKSVFYISKDTKILSKDSYQLGKTQVISVSNAPVFECLIAAINKEDREPWLHGLNQSLKHYLNDTSPTQLVLSEQPLDVVDAKANNEFMIKREKSFRQYKTAKEERKKLKKAENLEVHETVRKGCLLRLNSVNTEREKIKNVFLDFDKDGNGYLEKKEFEMALKEMGLKFNESEISDIFIKIDSDGNGKIMFSEFYDFFLENILCYEKSVFCQAFDEADKKGRGVVNFKEFSEFVRTRHGTVSLDKVLSSFDALCGVAKKDELSCEDFIQSMSIFDELGLFPSSLENFEAQLKSRFDTCDINDLKDKIRKRWNKFASFKRPGQDGKIAMKGGSDIVDDLVPGEYSLQDLAKFHDLPTILPKRTIVKGVLWESSNIPNTSGNIVFPSEFNGHLEVETATNEFLAYYECEFADGKSEKIFLPYRHAIQDFTYENDYLTNYVEKMNRGAGLERHDFTHLDCPLTDDSGYFILGKLIEDELHITAFKIPKRHTLYIPGNCLHSNDYLKGTWRTMLSDESNIDHVHLKRRKGRKTQGGDEDFYLESFTFQFSC